MAECFLVQRGGVPLNFKVVGNPKPDSPKENMLWVDTEKVAAWTFRASQPEAPEEGLIWFRLADFSEAPFNALRKNELEVYVFAAQKYSGGSWEDVAVEIYQGGQWKPFWDGTLFYMGNRYEEHTGGWTGRRMSFGETTISATGSYYNDYGHGSIYNLKGVDVTKYNTLTVNITTAIISNNEAHFGLSASPGGNFAASARITATGTMDLDITNLKGSYYFLFRTDDTYTSATTTVAFDTIRLRNR